MNKKIVKLPDTELEIMKVIWNNETPISTTKVKEHLEKMRPWNVSALQTLLNRLIARGFLKSKKEGKNRYYEPLINEDEYLAFENKKFLKKVNDNSITRLVTSLYDHRAINDEDLEELRQFIEQKTKGE
jgi:BlaI family penicillinase repressor